MTENYKWKFSKDHLGRIEVDFCPYCKTCGNRFIKIDSHNVLRCTKCDKTIQNDTNLKNEYKSAEDCIAKKFSEHVVYHI